MGQGQPHSVKILQQGPARSMGGPSVDESPPQKKTGGPGKTRGGPGPPHATGLVKARLKLKAEINTFEWIETETNGVDCKPNDLDEHETEMKSNEPGPVVGSGISDEDLCRHEDRFVNWMGLSSHMCKCLFLNMIINGENH